jgi:formiminoglutamase
VQKILPLQSLRSAYLNSRYYRCSDPKVWKGRIDSEKKERVFQYVQFLDCLRNDFIPSKAICLCGFSVDEGVRRNLGRPGAQEGPAAIRKQLANLCLNLPESIVLLDMGDIECSDGNLEEAQVQLGILVRRILAANAFPVVMGGGHETAFGTYQGLHAFTGEFLSICNFDAHFDLKPVLNGQGTSGTPFTQIAEACAKDQREFFYTCIGIQPSSNTESLFSRSRDYGAQYFLAEDIAAKPKEVLSQLQPRLEGNLYVSFCLDVLHAAQAPGVSAPQTLGLFAWQILPFLDACLASSKLLAFDLVELAPRYDNQDITAKFAAEVIRRIIVAQILKW